MKHHYISVRRSQQKALMQYLADRKIFERFIFVWIMILPGIFACRILAEKISDDKMTMRLKPAKKDWNECLTAGLI